MVDVAQLVRASDCGSEGRRFEPDLPPKVRKLSKDSFFYEPIFSGSKTLSFTDSTTCFFLDKIIIS